LSSQAFKEFKGSLSMAEELLNIEKTNYSNPPHINEQKPVQGLRGAVAVLVVASFELFLRASLEEHLSELTKYPFIAYHKLPDIIKINNTYNTLERAMKGPLFEEHKAKKDRLEDIDIACRKLVSGIINPAAFSATGGNPSASTVKSMLKSIGIDDIFALIEAKFIKKWGKPVASTFLVDKLNEIVNRRHVVAHTANALNITRNQLKESVKFVTIITELIDSEIRNKIALISRSAIRP